MLVNNCGKYLLYPCHKTQENLRETGELKAGGVNIFLVQYGPDARQTSLNNFYKKQSK